MNVDRSYRTVMLADPARRAWDAPDRPRPLRCYLWEPARFDGRVVLLSHGTGASGQDLAWLAEPLAAAGFLAASVDHHGNNWVDGYLAPGFLCLWERPRDLSVLLTHLAAQYDVRWAGAAGFSAGGYTAAALVGVRLAAGPLAAVAAGDLVLPEIPEFPGAFDWLRAGGGDGRLDGAAADHGDPRIAAAFAICPGEGGLSDEASLRAVDRPVELRWAGADVIAPPELTALRYLALIPGAAGQSLGPDVRHQDLFPDEPAGAAARAAAAAGAVAFFSRLTS